MTEDEMVEAAIRAGEEAADNDFKLKFEQAQKELADVRNELDAAAEAQKAAEDKAKDATERTARLQADWENFRRRTANERIGRARARDREARHRAVAGDRRYRARDRPCPQPRAFRRL